MLKKLPFLTLICLLAFDVYSLAESVDEIINKNIEARGGLEKINALKSMKLTGKMTIEQDVQAPILVYQKRPNFVRLEFTIKEMTGIQAYDGQTAWMIMPFMGTKEPQKMPEDDARDIIEQSDFDGPLVNYKAKGNTVELVDKEDLQGSAVYKIKVTLKSGSVRYFFLDGEKYLDRKITRTIKIQGREVSADTFFEDYKDINGLMVPFFVNSKVGDQMINQIRWDNVEFDVPIDDSIFKMPAEVPQSSPSK